MPAALDKVGAENAQGEAVASTGALIMLATIFHFFIGYTAVSVCFSLALAQFIRHSRKWSGWQTGTNSLTTIVAATGISGQALFFGSPADSGSVSDRLLALHEILTPERVLRREPAEIDWAARAQGALQSPRSLAPAVAASSRQCAEARLSEISPVPIL
jgi:hypothetical protein